MILVMVLPLTLFGLWRPGKKGSAAGSRLRVCSCSRAQQSDGLTFLVFPSPPLILIAGPIRLGCWSSFLLFCVPCIALLEKVTW